MPLGTWWRCNCTVYVCENVLGMLKLMLGAIVLHHTRGTPLLGAAHRPREARGTFKVTNPVPTRRATRLVSDDLYVTVMSDVST